MRSSSGIAVAARSGRSLERPAIADRKALFMAEASRLDAAYGRSLTYRPSEKPSGASRRPAASRRGSISTISAAVQRVGSASGKQTYARPVGTSTSYTRSGCLTSR